MLPERDRELLTAYVDGELTARQRKHVTKLLQKSPEARILLERLQSDSKTLKALSKPTLELDLSQKVLSQIDQRGITVKPTGALYMPPPGGTFPAWVGVTVVAGTVATLGLVSYAVFLVLLR